MYFLSIFPERLSHFAGSSLISKQKKALMPPLDLASKVATLPFALSLGSIDGQSIQWRMERKNIRLVYCWDISTLYVYLYIYYSITNYWDLRMTQSGQFCRLWLKWWYRGIRWVLKFHAHTVWKRCVAKDSHQASRIQRFPDLGLTLCSPAVIEPEAAPPKAVVSSVYKAPTLMIQKGPTYMYRKNIHVDTPVSPFILYMLAISEVWIYPPAIKHCNSNCGALRRQSASSACHTISNRQLEKAHFQFLELDGFWINEAVSCICLQNLYHTLQDFSGVKHHRTTIPSSSTALQ